MTKQEVIVLRDTLKSGKNLPIQVYIDNAFAFIDESNVAQFTLWDDDNGILFSFRLPTIEIEDYGTSNKAENVSVYAFTYEQIQGMAIALLPLDDLSTVLGSINKIRPISDKMQNLIVTTYSKILKENYAEMKNEDWNRLVGSNLDTQEDYFEGKTTPNRGKQYPNERSYYLKKVEGEDDGSYKPTGDPTIDGINDGVTGDASADINKLAGQMALLNNRVANVNTGVKDMNEKVDDINTKVDDLGEKVEGLETEVSDLNSKVNGGSSEDGE